MVIFFMMNPRPVNRTHENRLVSILSIVFPSYDDKLNQGNFPIYSDFNPFSEFRDLYNSLAVLTIKMETYTAKLFFTQRGTEDTEEFFVIPAGIQKKYYERENIHK